MQSESSAEQLPEQPPKKKRRSQGNGAPKGSDTRLMARQRVLNSLAIASQLGGWITTTVMAHAFWPRNKSAKKYAERLMADMLFEGYLLKRVLPNRMTAGVITAKGVKHYEGQDLVLPEVLDSVGLYSEIRAGTSWGEVKGDTWVPPSTWRHQLRAGNFVAWLASEFSSDYLMAFDSQIHRDNPRAPKVPDGLVYHQDMDELGTVRKGVWIEVEHARKTGSHLHKMIDAILAITSRNRAVKLEVKHTSGFGMWLKCNQVYVVVPPTFRLKNFEMAIRSKMAGDEKATIGIAIEQPDYGFTLSEIVIDLEAEAKAAFEEAEAAKKAEALEKKHSANLAVIMREAMLRATPHVYDDDDEY